MFQVKLYHIFFKHLIHTTQNYKLSLAFDWVITTEKKGIMPSLKTKYSETSIKRTPLGPSQVFAE